MHTLLQILGVLYFIIDNRNQITGLLRGKKTKNKKQKSSELRSSKLMKFMRFLINLMMSFTGLAYITIKNEGPLIKISPIDIEPKRRSWAMVQIYMTCGFVHQYFLSRVHHK